MKAVGRAFSLLTCAALLGWLGCGGASETVAEPGERAPGGGKEKNEGDRGGGSCEEAFAEYVKAWTRWFEVELEDEDAIGEMVAAFREELPERSGLAEMREVAAELRYEPGFERWLVALDATEYAIEICGEGVRRPGA